MTKASTDVLAERQRQIDAEGWTVEHDSQHSVGELAVAAGCYALYADAFPNPGEPPKSWPWEASWWKPTNYRRDMVKAAALLLAAIEQVDISCVHAVVDTTYLDGLVDYHRCRGCGKEWSEIPA